jgi:thiol-disulfide isomerase/thioredoxin
MVKNLILAGLVIALAGFTTWGLDKYFKNQRGDFFVLEHGQMIPDFEFKTINGNTHALYDFKGKPVLIHFWASWCAPCVVEFPELIALAHNNPDITILAFSSDILLKSVDRFLNKHAPDLPPNFKIIHDKNKDITEGKFNVFRLPETYIVNDDMTLKNHIVGAYQGWVKSF